MGNYNRHTAARILVDAISMGDKKAAKRHGVTERTIGNYRARLETDGELSALFEELRDKVDRDWATARSRALRIAADRASQLLAKTTDIAAISDFIQKAGHLDVASEALGVGGVPDYPRGQQPPSDPGGPSGAGTAKGGAAGVE